MQQVEALMLKIAALCDRLRLEYFVTGSVASMAWGEPRATLDVDIVIELPSWNVQGFCAAFPAPDYYVSPDAAMDAAQRTSQFNVLHVPQGVKADIMVFRDTPHNNARLARARIVKFGDTPVRFAAPEDVILKKLEFYREGGSDKHLRDVGGIIRVSGDQLDYPYIERWAATLGVTDQWRAVHSRCAEP